MSDAALVRPIPIHTFRQQSTDHHEPNYQTLYLTAQRRFERERRARQAAETIAEEGLRLIHQRERHAFLLEAIARHANGSSSQEDALQSALHEICHHSSWTCGFVYVPEPDAGNRLSLLPGWVVIGEGLEPFVAATQTICFPLSQGLPGRVAAAKQAAWIRDVAHDDNFMRKDVAITCGLRAGVAFPILVNSEIAAVVEFFAREALEPDPAFLSVLEAVGTQLGRVVEREAARAKLVYDATHDALTGLPNRAHFLDQLSARVDHASSDYAVLFIDLDRFKLVNDSLGHRAGDILLVLVAARFTAALERIGSPFLLARLGGDEFVVLVERIADPGQAAAVAETLLTELSIPIEVEGQALYGSASIGVTCGSSGYEQAADVMRDADLAMYEAKRLGKARFAMFEPQLHQQASVRLAVESDLRHALREGQFVVHYQPIVMVQGSQLAGFEALVRWQRAPGVLVPPDAFIGVAEETGLIVFIGDQVLRQACAAVARWNADRPANAMLSVAVNMSARQFQQGDFVESIQRALREAGARPEWLKVELTESTAVANISHAAAVLRTLRELGVQVSIDDFGTGHSSLSYLHQLTFDTIKIDRCFVQSMCDGDGEHIVQTVLDLARNLNVTVIAEGAETEQQVAKLDDLGCSFMQGYFVSRPLDEAAATVWLARSS